MRKFIVSFLDFCEKIFIVLANGCLIIMLGANALNILSRAIFNKAISGVFPWSMVLFVWMVFLGFYVFTRRGRNVSVDFLSSRLSGVPQKVLCLLIDTVILIVLGCIIYTIRSNLRQQVGILEMIGLQRYTLSIPFYLSCALLFIHTCVDITGVFSDKLSR